MILDYNYNRYKKNLSVSYVTRDGGKKILNFNVDRFKSFYSTPSGQYENWDGSRCDIRYVEKPCTFDIKTYFEEMPEQYRKLLQGKTPPKLYTFDIETMINEETNEFPEPSEAKFPITVISVVSPDLNCIVLGTNELSNEKQAELQLKFDNYLMNIPFSKELKLTSKPYIKFVKFPNEHDMLEYFLKNIVAKVPVIAGWNSLMFDWQYIQNRIRGYYSDISLNCSSYNYTTHIRKCKDQKNNDVTLTLPDHTLVLDMMDVIENFDMVVMPLKESMSLDYVSQEMLGAHKIKYKGSLQDLYNNDYAEYVFYNAIDSILVQLLDKRFKTLSNIYAQSLYCREKIGSCFSKIALTESLVFNYFYSIGKKVVPTDDIWERERGRLIGAYVKDPMPGKHKFVCCNDFSGLYPSEGQSMNLSFEGYIGAFWDTKKIEPYLTDSKYIVIGPNVHINEGTKDKPEIGSCIGTFLDEEKLEPYRKDPNYIVSVNGSVYKNDKDYSLRCIWSQLRKDRNVGKYLAKQLDAQTISDIDHILKGTNIENRTYNDNIINAIKEIGYDIKCSDDIKRLSKDEISNMKLKLKDEILYYISYEQACKLLMNSIYGGISFVSMFWYNINIANDITAGGRNLIHMMEKHIPEFLQQNWFKMKDLHEKLGIKIKPEYAKYCE